jgi:hypothetical protein
MWCAYRVSHDGAKLVLVGWWREVRMAGTMKNKATSKHTRQSAVGKLGAQTRAIHAGEGVRHGVGGPVSAPICRTSTFTFSSTAEMKRWAEGKSKAYIYTRYGNPSLAIAE